MLDFTCEICDLTDNGRNKLLCEGSADAASGHETTPAILSLIAFAVTECKRLVRLPFSEA